MFGNWFGGLFGGGNKPQMMDMTQGADALGQAAAGSPMAFGSGPAPGGMDRNKLMLAMIMARKGFNSGMSGYNSAPMPQLGNVYQRMAPQQQGGGWFNPMGGWRNG